MCRDRPEPVSSALRVRPLLPLPLTIRDRSNWGYKWRKTDGGAPLAFTNVSSTDEVEAEGGPDPDAVCRHWYPGRRAFEAPESNALAGLVHVIPDVAAFIELRAYGQIGTFAPLI